VISSGRRVLVSIILSIPSALRAHRRRSRSCSIARSDAGRAPSCRPDHRSKADSAVHWRRNETDSDALAGEGEGVRSGWARAHRLFPAKSTEKEIARRPEGGWSGDSCAAAIATRMTTQDREITSGNGDPRSGEFSIIAPSSRSEKCCPAIRQSRRKFFIEIIYDQLDRADG